MFSITIITLPTVVRQRQMPIIAFNVVALTQDIILKAKDIGLCGRRQHTQILRCWENKTVPKKTKQRLKKKCLNWKTKI